jgi:hypothetical protein
VRHAENDEENVMSSVLCNRRTADGGQCSHRRARNRRDCGRHTNERTAVAAGVASSRDPDALARSQAEADTDPLTQGPARKALADAERHYRIDAKDEDKADRAVRRAMRRDYGLRKNDLGDTRSRISPDQHGHAAITLDIDLAGRDGMKIRSQVTRDGGGPVRTTTTRRYNELVVTHPQSGRDTSFEFYDAKSLSDALRQARDWQDGPPPPRDPVLPGGIFR